MATPLPILLAAGTNITIAGAGSWTCPANVSAIQIEVWGGGGGGGGAQKVGVNSYGGGGGGGAYARLNNFPVNAGSNYVFFVGAAGTAGATNGGNGGGGGQTYFINPSVLAANGGSGGLGRTNGFGTGGAGGVAGIIGDIQFSGGTGATSSSTTVGGQGGGSAGNVSNGNNGTNNAPGPVAAVPGGGPGGAPNTSGASGPGLAPTSGPGGGGGGARSANGTGYSGGAGMAGQLSISYSMNYSVGSVTALQAAINSASAGDTITISNGTYFVSNTIAITCVGTSNAPILIKAQTIGGVTIGGASGFDFQSPAAWVTVQGIIFTNAGSKLAIEYGTSHCRITRSVIQCAITNGDPTGLWYVKLAGDDAQFDHNEVRNKNSVGQMLRVEGDGIGQMAQRVWVHHNYFHDNVYQNNANGVETVRWGLGIYAGSSGYGLMEYNLFDRCDGDAAEMISNKSCNNTYRFNTFLNTVNDSFKLRTGTNCLVYGNCFSNTIGLVIWNYYHQVYGNYFINNAAAIEIGNGDTNVLDLSGNATHTEPRYCVIAFNTLINNAKQYWMDNQYIYGAQSNTFANNIIVGSASAASFQGAYANGFWTNNLIWNTTVANTAPGNMPAGAYTKTNPLITVADAFGALHLQSNSPAIGAAAPGFTNVLVDMDGQPRPLTGADIGADEFSAATVTAHFLTTNDVGPLALNSATVTLTNLTQYYDGLAHAVGATTIPAGLSVSLTYNGSSSAPTNAGSYTVLGIIVDVNYQGAATNTLNIVAPVLPQTTNVFINAGGNFVLSGIGQSGQSYRILATTNLLLPATNWLSLTTNIFSGGIFNFTDSPPATLDARYYRVVSP